MAADEKINRGLSLLCLGRCHRSEDSLLVCKHRSLFHKVLSLLCRLPLRSSCGQITEGHLAPPPPPWDKAKLMPLEMDLAKLSPSETPARLLDKASPLGRFPLQSKV